MVWKSPREEADSSKMHRGQAAWGAGGVVHHTAEVREVERAEEIETPSHTLRNVAPEREERVRDQTVAKGHPGKSCLWVFSLCLQMGGT